MLFVVVGVVVVFLWPNRNYYKNGIFIFYIQNNESACSLSHGLLYKFDDSKYIYNSKHAF